MYLGFDTETAGLPKDYKAPVHDLANWPRVVQIGWVICDDDGQELDSEEHIIYPDGFKIPQAATEIHGISHERALLEGKYISGVIDSFERALEQVQVALCHNAHFDTRVWGAEMIRAKAYSPFHNADGRKDSGFPFRCTMNESTDFCAIPGFRGRNKWPKLIELHEKLFGEGFFGAHSALVDVRAMMRCFFELKRRGVM